MTSATVLSLNDRAVLGALFDPEVLLIRNNEVQPNTTSLTTSVADTIPASVKAAEQQAIQLLNQPEPSEADTNTAVSRLTDLITTNPTYASAYNNRAQALRLLPNATITLPVLSSILNDLNTAITLSTPASLLLPISIHDSRVLASAHAHRGYLLLRASTNDSFRERFLSATSSSSSSTGLDLSPSTTPSHLEELASKDFSIAGRYGNETARQLAVKTNPYAKLCGQIVKEAMEREIKEYYEGSGQ